MSAAAPTAGWARADITPPLGSRLRGYYVERLAEGVHDPLCAKAVYLAEGAEAVAFVALDLCAVDRRVTQAARALVSASCGLPPERLILHCTHTHLGPHSVEHVDQLAAGVDEAVRAAQASARPVVGASGRGFEDSVAFCRRFVMRDGSIRTNPGRRNPDVVGPTAPIDPHLEVLALTPESGGAPCVLVNYALHLDTVGGKIMGADYPYFVEELLRKVFGPDLFCLFIQGCSGDVNHIDVNRETQPKGFPQAEEIGTVLGAEVLKALARRRPVALTPLRFASRELPIDIEQPSPKELEAARRRFYDEPDRRLGRELVEARRAIRRSELGTPYAMAVAAFRAGEVGLLAFPGELFCEFGLRLKDCAASRLTITAELCFDDVGYIPTPDGLAAGAYEGWSGLFPPDAGDRIVDAALDLMGALGAG